MNNKQFSQNAISHKDLSDFLIKAKKDITSINVSGNHQTKENQKFNNLIKTWTETNQKILLMIDKEQKVFSKSRDPKSLIAFGAMGAHTNMALQALKATESDQ